MNLQLDSYIKQARAAGQSDEQIKQALLQSGWNQMHVNEAFGLPNPPSTPVIPPLLQPSSTVSASPQSTGMPGDFFDQKTKDTIMWSVVGYFIRSVVIGLATSIGVYMFFSSVSIYGINVPLNHLDFYFNFGSVVYSSIIGGLIFGLVVAKLYPKLEGISRKYFGNWFYNFYRMIFYPVAIAGVLGLILTGGFFLFLGRNFFLYLLVIIAGDVAGSYVFAKLMVNKVGKYYSENK